MDTPDKPLRIARRKTILFVAVLFVALVVASGFALRSKKVVENTTINGIDYGLLPASEVRQTLAAWWGKAKDRPITFVGPRGDVASLTKTPAEIGLLFDLDKTIAAIPLEGIDDWARRVFKDAEPKAVVVTMVFSSSGIRHEKLQEVALQTSPRLSSASVTMDEHGHLVHRYEDSSMKLSLEPTIKSLEQAVVSGEPCRVVGEFGTKRVSDADVDLITDVVSEFSTKFSVGDRQRSANLKLAASKINGKVLLPGEKFSFNDVVGERSQANGFNLAGVYRRGRHEIDFGGGVCQVSTTLFNAAMFANLKKDFRANHSFAVPYVPVGRDAAVAYGLQDMAFTNTMGKPIAIAATWKPGLLTFRVLGQKDAALRVELSQVVTSTWTHPVTYVEDASLSPGAEKVLEKGGRGYKAITTRKVFRGDVLVTEEVLYKSYYKGAPKIVARGPLVVPPLEFGSL